MIAGTSNLLKPAATEAAVFPAFMFLACCGLAIGLAFTFSVVRHMAKRRRRTPRLASRRRCRSRQHLAPHSGSDRNGANLVIRRGGT